MVEEEALGRYLGEQGIAAGELELEPIGEGHSNLTYRLRRGAGEDLVLRRPPHGPLPPSAHDVLREARILKAIAPLGFPVPEVIAICEGEEVIGAPFYLMPFLDGHVLSGELPAGLGEGAPPRIAAELVDTLVRLHAIDYEAAGLVGLGRPDGYLERQLKRFGGLLERNATRALPELDRVGEWLAANLPDSPEATLVHGDYRLGNVMFARREPRPVAVLDWEMATIGDPLADVGYMTAMWSRAEDPPNPVGDLSAVTRLPGFPPPEELVERYAAATGRAAEALPWYQALALWKAAIFLEGSYRRYREGTTRDPYFGTLGEGVELLAELAARRISSL